MNAPRLEELLEQLGLPEDGDEGIRFMAVAIPGMEKHRIGRGSDGEPALLLSPREEKTGRIPPSIQLEHLVVQHDVRCRLQQGDGNVLEAPFTVLRYTGGDTELRSHFVRVLGPLLLSLGDAPSRSAIYGAVDGLVALFRALSQPPRKSAQGLWAELLLIAYAANPALLVEAWHATPEDRYDFSAGSERIEVKSASTRARRHRFSLAQLHSPASTDVLIASMLVESAGAGLSLAELIQQVHDRLNETPDLSLRVDQIVSSTLGSGLSQALELRFDFELAVDSLQFYKAHCIPSIPCDIPAVISDVRFVVDLEGLMPDSPTAIEGSLVQALLPLRR